MIIHDALFVKSSTRISQCPPPDKPEFAFLGRSNVGKSSLINSLTGRNSLAKTSGKPGKTQTINHFLVNDAWYLADLPGYGYAKVSKKTREEWQRMIESYVINRENLLNLFLLIDSRHEPIDSDVDFINWLGINGIPFSRVYTKADKVKRNALENTLKMYDERLLESWEELPPAFVTSAVDSRGREDLLDYIEKSITYFTKP